MASVVYPLILFIFIFGSGLTFINETGLYAVKMPTSGVSADISQAETLNEAMTETSKSGGMSTTEQIWLMGKCLIGGVMAIFTLGPLLQSFGIPGGMIVFLISPLPIVVSFWLIEMYLGRPAE
jgi:hypothetical protein